MNYNEFEKTEFIMYSLFGAAGYLFVSLACQSVSQLSKPVVLRFRHFGLDPWFDRLTTLSEVEGESSAVLAAFASGCRIKSGMTGSS